MVGCTYPSNSTATGFQLIAQPSNSSRVHKLSVTQTRDRQSPATIQVDESGTYQVTIFPIREGTGILYTNVEYTEKVVLMMDDEGIGCIAEVCMSMLTLT